MSLDRRTMAMVEAELYCWRLYEEIKEHGIVEMAQRRPYWMPLGIQRHRVPQPVLDAITALEADRRYQRCIAVLDAIRRAGERMGPQEHAMLWLLYWHHRNIVEAAVALRIGRRRAYQLRARVVQIAYEEFAAAGIEPYARAESA